MASSVYRYVSLAVTNLLILYPVIKKQFHLFLFSYILLVHYWGLHTNNIRRDDKDESVSEGNKEKKAGFQSDKFDSKSVGSRIV